MIDKSDRSRFLLELKYDNGRVVYTTDYRMEVEGSFWPRELASAVAICKIYAEQNKITNGIKAQ